MSAVMGEDVRILVPIAHLLDGVVPADWIAPVGDALDFIAIDPARSSLRWDPTGFVTRQRLVFTEEIVLDLPLIAGAQLRLGRPGATLEVDFTVATEPSPWIEVDAFTVTLHLPPDIAKAYRELPSGGWGPVEEDGVSSGYDLVWETGIRATFDGDVEFRAPTLSSVAAAMIADSGFVLEITRLAIITGPIPTDLPPELTERIPPGFVGILLECSLRYWKPGNDFTPTFTLDNGAIGSGGFSGTVAFGDPEQAETKYDDETLNRGVLPSGLMRCDLGGGKVVLQLFSVTFAQSIPTGSQIIGYLFLPFVDKWKRISASIGGPDGDFMIEIGGAGDEELVSIEVDWLEILVDSLAYVLKDDKHYVKITGSARPKIGDFDWPKVQVDDLLIGSDGSVEMEGGWLDVPETFNLDFHAFKIELRRIGFGTEGEDAARRNWVGLSGGIRLLEGVPLSASVSGLKVAWSPPPAPDPQIQVSIEGVALSLEIPNVLKIEGAMSYRELPRPPDELAPDDDIPLGGNLTYGHVFSGGINLEITCLNMAVAGEILIGELTAYHWEGRTRRDDANFVSLFIMLNVDLPTAIPLGATGAGLYGVKGLVGINVAPDRHLDDEGEPESWYTWYKADRGQGSAYSVARVVKFAPRHLNFAFGAGVKIGTVYDDGFTINAGVLAAVLIPGPVVMIEGRANLLKQRTGDGQGMEGALYALIVFDGLAETFQMNIDVNFAMEDVITVAGGLEAFFDFNDSSRWFIHIGKKEPLDGSKRIRADILSIITAKAYFMIEPIGIQFGAAVGVELEYEYGPLEIKLILRLSFDVAVFWKEPQISGAIELHVELSIKVFGIGLGLLLHCGLDAHAPQPWWLHGIAQAALTLPFPLPSFDVQVEFTWGQLEPPAVVDLLKAATMVAPKQTGAAWALPGVELTSGEDLAAAIGRLPPTDKWPLVPVDSLPALSLGKPLTSISLVKDGDAGMHVFVEEPGPVENEGVFFSYFLREVELLVRTDAGTWTPAITRFTPSASQLRMRPDPYAMEPQVELWWYAPLDSFDPQSRRNYVDPCPGPVWPELHCVDWRGVPLGTTYAPIFRRRGLTFTHDIRQDAVVTAVTALSAESPDRGLALRTLKIRFPEPIWAAEITWAMRDVQLRAYRNGNSVTPEIESTPGIHKLSVSSGLDTLHLTASGSVDLRELPIITSICWRMLRDAVGSLSRPSVTGSRTELRSNLVLEPNRSYALRATGVRAERREGETTTTEARQTLMWGFHTGGLPGTDYEQVTTPSPCDFADSVLNQVSSYVARTVPRNGAPLFYRGYDVLVELVDPYGANMLRPVLSMRIFDRNGTQLVPAVFDFLTGALPFLTPGLATMLSAPREAACVGAAVPWTPQVLERFVAARLPETTPPGKMVRVELIAALPYGPQKVFEFEFATSRFRDAAHHLSLGARRTLGRVVTVPVAWITDVQARTAARHSSRETLSAALVFGPHDAGMTIEEAHAQMSLTTAALSAACNEAYAALDALVHPLFVAAGLAHRPLPPRSVEVLFIEADAGRFLLVESPEPIDWLRVSVRQGTTVLPVAWNDDGTRAFIFAASEPWLFTTGPSLAVAHHRGGVAAPDLEPLYRMGVMEAAEDVITWDLGS